MATLFFSYSHRDESIRDELEIHLAMLKRQGVISAWHDRRIDAGSNLDHSISEHLERADIVLLLVSAYFLASDYCYDVEMRRAMERHEIGAAVVIPVILNSCDWQQAPFGRLKAVPKDGKPVAKYANPHDAFLEITQEIRRVVQRIGQETRPSSLDEVDVVQRTPTPVVRTSNLRVRRSFTDHDRDGFVDEGFEYIAKFFETSLQELQSRHAQINTRMKRTSESSFTAAIYIGGDKRSACRIWLPGRGGFGGDIAYSMSEASDTNGFNESMTVYDDGYALGFKPLGLTQWGRPSEDHLTHHGAAEYFWAVFVSPLQ